MAVEEFRKFRELSRTGGSRGILPQQTFSTGEVSGGFLLPYPLIEIVWRGTGEQVTVTEEEKGQRERSRRERSTSAGEESHSVIPPT
jgi:hypothetical protein